MQPRQRPVHWSLVSSCPWWCQGWPLWPKIERTWLWAVNGTNCSVEHAVKSRTGFLRHCVRSGYSISRARGPSSRHRFGRESWFLRKEKAGEPGEKPSESNWDQPITAHVHWVRDWTRVAVVGGRDDDSCAKVNNNKRILKWVLVPMSLTTNVLVWESTGCQPTSNFCPWNLNYT